MKVQVILEKKGTKVVTTWPDARVGFAARQMRDRNVGALVAVSQDGCMLGIISERDIAAGLAEHGVDLLNLRVRDLMTEMVVTCTPQDTIRTVMGLMTSGRIRHLPVVDNGRLCGVLSIGDVVKDRLEEVELETNVLRDAYITCRDVRSLV